MKVHHLPFSSPTSLYLGCDILSSLPFESWVGGRPVLVLSDERVGALYGERLLAHLRPHAAALHLQHLPAGDKHKSFESLAPVFSRMLDLKMGRDSVVVALGGGQVCDMAGFFGFDLSKGRASFELSHKPPLAGGRRDWRKDGGKL